jgi:hypothetical protein
MHLLQLFPRGADLMSSYDAGRYPGVAAAAFLYPENSRSTGNASARAGLKARRHDQ